jgi:hypothetical protein
MSETCHRLCVPTRQAIRRWNHFGSRATSHVESVLDLGLEFLIDLTFATMFGAWLMVALSCVLPLKVGDRMLKCAPPSVIPIFSETGLAAVSHLKNLPKLRKRAVRFWRWPRPSPDSHHSRKPLSAWSRRCVKRGTGPTDG